VQLLGPRHGNEQTYLEDERKAGLHKRVKVHGHPPVRHQIRRGFDWRRLTTVSEVLHITPVAKYVRVQCLRHQFAAAEALVLQLAQYKQFRQSI
jgi:hypothetical protein